MRFSSVLTLALALVAPTAIAACGSKAGSSPGATDPAKMRALPVNAADNGKGVSLTGDYPYDDEHDPSGWGGKTELPGAVGGGPVTAPSVSPAGTPVAGAPATSAAPAGSATPTAGAPTANGAPPQQTEPAAPKDTKGAKTPAKKPSPAPTATPPAPTQPPAPPSKELIPDSKELVP